jgi:DNA-binding CsgD family transcriptional regulator/tetratricopeptide (TPR) repeat protein
MMNLMPKNRAEIARESMARKRQRARDAGLCYECCKQKPNPGRTVCVPCRAVKVQRKKRKRQREREVAVKSRYFLEAHERAGDVAREHHVYELAAQHYEDALQVPNADESAWMRLSEKLAEVLLYGNEPGAAGKVNERLLAIYRLYPERRVAYIKTLFRVARQLWVDSRTKDKVLVLRKAIHIAELSNNWELLQQANIHMANTFVQLGRFEEAERYLHTIDQLHRAHAIGTLTNYYYTQKGVVAAGLGREKEAFASFDRAIEIIRDETDPYRAAVLWTAYGSIARMFGRTKLTKAYFEHGLLAARRSGIAWLIPLSCLWYAEFLRFIGEYPSAHEYLIEALSYDAQTPILDENIASAGILLALQIKDEATLEKCVRPHVIDRVFLSGEPLRIGRVAVAFARLYVERGQRKKAQMLLHRAAQAMHNATEALYLPLEIARCGAKTDFPKARKLLEARIALPGAQVAQAYLHLFDAFVAQREGRRAHAQAQARDAAARFDGFKWHLYADLARSLLPLEERHRSAVGTHHAKPFSDTHAKFTEREQQVAELVLKGLTNRAIADTLRISPHTVDSHVNAIMSRLGIRSRHQLADAFIQPSEVNEPIP